MRPARPLLLSLAGSVALLTTIQCLALVASNPPRVPSYVGLHYSQAIHTREEVGDSGVDLSIDACREWAPSSANADQKLSLPNALDDVEVDVVPLRQLLHRRVSPASSDDSLFLS